jgi:hypothetical protein
VQPVHRRVQGFPFSQQLHLELGLQPAPLDTPETTSARVAALPESFWCRNPSLAEAGCGRAWVYSA